MNKCKKDRKFVGFWVSSGIKKKLDILADCYSMGLSELMRNWTEDILAWLKDGTLVLDRKRHLALHDVNYPKRIVKGLEKIKDVER